MENKDSAEIKNLTTLVSLNESIADKRQSIIFSINSKAGNINHDMKNTKTSYEGEGDNRMANLSMPYRKYTELMEFLSNLSSDDEKLSRIGGLVPEYLNEIKIKKEIIKTLK